jgi:hypothetical protein
MAKTAKAATTVEVQKIPMGMTAKKAAKAAAKKVAKSETFVRETELISEPGEPEMVRELEPGEEFSTEAEPELNAPAKKAAPKKAAPKKAATKTAKKPITKATKFVAPVAPDDYRTDEYQTGDTPTPKKATAKKSAKSTKTAKSANKAVTKTVAVARKPNPLHEKLIALMARKDGATISDFQTVDGFNIPSMAALRIAERHGYTATASKKPGERTVYKAVKRAGG